MSKKFGSLIFLLYFCTRFCETSKVSLAQLVEQLTLNQWVEGSSPSGDTSKDIRLGILFY